MGPDTGNYQVLRAYVTMAGKDYVHPTTSDEEGLNQVEIINAS